MTVNTTLLRLMESHEVPLTRANFIYLNWGEFPYPWTAEHEAQLPPVLQRREFDESKHPREPAGSPTGGEFASGGGGTGGGKKKIEISDFQKAKVNLAHRVTHDRVATEKFLETWNEHIHEAPEEFRQDFLGGLPASMYIDVRGDKWVISGRLQDADGEGIGDYNRTIEWDKREAESAFFKLDSTETGHAIGKTLLAANVETYQKLGLDSVIVHANIDVGGYAWAKYGYVPTPQSWPILRGEIADKVAELAGESTTYTASSWDELSDSQQENIFSAWAESTHSEFLDSEVESWRATGDPLEIAKTDLAARLWQRHDWALEAVQGYLADHPDVPFTDKQILDAMSIDYHGGRRGDGTDDPEITFDDQKLQEPKGHDPAQLELPGVESVNPEERLTQDMRDGIEAEMIKAFNDKAEEDAADIDPPDYLSDNVREYQIEAWDQMGPRDRFSWAADRGMIEAEEREGRDASIDEDTARALKQLTDSRDPKALWAIADSAYGKQLLLGADWNGRIDFHDPETMARFNAYVGRGKSAKPAEARKFFDEGKHPREPAGTSTGGEFTSVGGAEGAEGGFEFVSPNVSNIGLAIAHNALGGERQKSLRQASGEVDRLLGVKSDDHNIIGAWKDGAENSLMSVSQGIGWDRLRVSGAMKGHLGDQKQVLLFRDEANGPAVLYKFAGKGTVQEIHDKLLDQGLAFHTLVPQKEGAAVYVADLDGSLHDAVAKASGNATVEYRFGRAEFIGTQSETGSDREQRDDARRAYEKIIDQSPVPGSQAVWQRVHHRWGEELTRPNPLTVDSITAEAPPQKPNSLSITDVAKQVNARAGHFLKERFGKSSIEDSSPETDAFLADAIADDLKSGLINGHSSPTWYSEKMQAAMKVVERMHPEVATDKDKRFAYVAALATTSQGETVDSNVRLAEQAYDGFNKTGKFPDNLSVKKSGVNANLHKLNKLVEKLGLDGTREFFSKEMTARELLQITGVKVQKTAADAIVNGSAVLGPKIGMGFYQNLIGNFKPITADIWFMRAWGRMTNTGIGQPDMEPIAERLRNALKDEGRKAPASLNALDKIATEVFAQHERDYVKHGDEYKSGERSKSELVHASERFVLSYGGKMIEAPRGAKQREFITKVFTQALDRLKSKHGIEMSPAEAQATWWNPEKVLYAHLGGRTKDVATDYEKSLRKYEQAHG